MIEDPNQGELIEKSEDEKKIYQQTPKFFKNFIKTLEEKNAEKAAKEKEEKRKAVINEILKK